MAILLRLCALLSVLRIGTLVAGGLSPTVAPTPEAQAFALTLIGVHATLTLMFLVAALSPIEHLATVYGAIAFAAVSVVTELYLTLIVLPPSPALVGVVDLILSFSLLIGLIESLPRLLRPTEQNTSSPQ